MFPSRLNIDAFIFGTMIDEIPGSSRNGTLHLVLGYKNYKHHFNSPVSHDVLISGAYSIDV